MEKKEGANTKLKSSGFGLLSPNVKLVVYTVGIYSVFIVWGVIQEKLTSAPYALIEPRSSSIIWRGSSLESSQESSQESSLEANKESAQEMAKWSYPIMLNVFMAFSAYLLSAAGDFFFPNTSSNGNKSNDNEASSRVRLGSVDVATNKNNKIDIDSNSNNSKNSNEKAKIKADVAASSPKSSSPSPPSYSFAELMISFWRPALTCALASPVGYSSLSYISYPLMVLAKSSKPVPVMLVGFLFYQKSYSWDKVLSVLLICIGVSAYSLLKTSKSKGGGSSIIVNNSNSTNSSINSINSSSIGLGDSVAHMSLESINLIIGISMVLLNLFLDAYTNNEQDSIYKKYKITSFQMMKYINIWQVGYLLLYLLCGAGVGLFLYNDLGSCELFRSVDMIMRSAELRFDIIIFCICASVGQILIFEVMKDFGSLTWITISVTRKLFTILVSIVKFNHAVNFYQWLGIAAVFAGMGIEIVVKYFDEEKKKKID